MVYELKYVYTSASVMFAITVLMNYHSKTIKNNNIKYAKNYKVNIIHVNMIVHCTLL